MHISITTTHQPATDLGYLLHKHPAKLQEFKISCGKAHVFYPEATEQKCTATLLLEIDSIDLVRTLKTPADNLSLQHYVNDRPYVASSFMSSAIANVYSSALNGKCKDKPELVDQKLPLEVEIAVLKVRGKSDWVQKIFEPLGYQVEATQHLLDEKFTDWGQSNYFTVKLKHQITLKELLNHLYVLLPVFDLERHYWVSSDSVEILLEKGGEWLKNHPHKSAIVHRYLKKIRHLAKDALFRLTNKEEDGEVADIKSEETQSEEKKKKVSMHQLRLQTALDALKASGARTVVDLGCGEGKLLKMLMRHSQFQKILGMDVSFRQLQYAKEKLYYDNLSPRQQERIQLIHGSLTYRDDRLAGYEAATLIEVIEHLDLERLAALERVVFEFARPKTIVVTTPNAEYNSQYEFLGQDEFRHDDHRFEWTRKEFSNWSQSICERFGYQAEIQMVGEEQENVGASSQMAVFRI